MTALRNLNSAVQSAEFPSHEFAQAVREWIAEATERMEPASDGAKVECVICQQPGYCDHDCPEMPEPTAPEYVATPMLGFPCENCGQQTLRKDGHVSHRASGDETEYYCDKPAQPEPAAPVGNEDCLKAKAEGPWLAEVLKPAAPVGEIPEAVRRAVDGLRGEAEHYDAEGRSMMAERNRILAMNLETFWRTHAAPPKVAMTEELEDLLGSIMSFADVDPDTQVKQIWRRKVAAVRARAAGVKLPPVEAIRRLLIFGSWPTGDDESYCAQKKAVIWLAELDAAEGKAETKEGK